MSRVVPVRGRQAGEFIQGGFGVYQRRGLWRLLLGFLLDS